MKGDKMRYVTMSLFLLALLLTGSVSECANILPNPGFEDWVDTVGVEMPLPWITTAILDSAGAYKSTNAHGGSYSLALAMAESLPGAATTAILIEGGTHYDFYMYYTVSSLASAGIIVLVESDADSNLVEHLQMLSYTPGWSQVSMGFDAHPSAILLTILLTSLSETIFFDDGVLDGLPGTGLAEHSAGGSDRDPLRLTVSPNPCRESTRIVLASGGVRQADLEIYDMSGRLVRSFRVEGGDGVVVWDLRDAMLRPVPTGTYFVRLNRGFVTASRRLTVIR
jgi:hypothetical protein